MKPDPTTLLGTLGVSLANEISPKLDSGYAKASLGVYTVLLTVAREEFDRGVARRVEENAALRELFTKACDVVENSALREELLQASTGEDTSLLLRQMEKSNMHLRALLIKLHAHIEELNTSDAKDIEKEIWNELRISTDRRKVFIGTF